MMHGDEKKVTKDQTPPKPRRESYQAPRVTFIEISTREALMAICKASSPMCAMTKGPGS